MEQLVEGLKKEVLKKIKEARNRDKKVIKVVEKMKKAEVKILKNDEWQIEKGLVLKKGKVYVLKDKKLRLEIIQLHHDTLIVGYREQ